ncbi:hypothetical protein PMIN03_008355 [Paraphaeosphaeria minitans]
MKFQLSAVVALFALAMGVCAQSGLLGQLPGCAVECFNASVSVRSCDLGSDTPEALDCLCSDVNFQTAFSTCVSSTCTVIESLQSTNASKSACEIPVRDNTAVMIGMTASFGSVAIVMVIMRLVSRGLSRDRTLGWDDLLIGVSGLCSFLQNVPVYVAGHFGFGKDMWVIPPDNITASLKWLYVAYFAYQLVEGFTQLSILAFYLRLVTSCRTKTVIWALVAVVSSFAIGNTFAMILQCRPIPFFWDGWRGDMAGKCTVNIRLFGFIRGGIEIVLDLVILALPLPMLSKLQMSLRKKLQIMSMFCVGFVITIVSCLRLWALVQFAQTTNPTYDNVSGLYWCVTEANLFVIVACMPAMRPIFRTVLPALFGSSHFSSQNSNYHNSSSAINGGGYGGNGGSGYGGRTRRTGMPMGMPLNVMVSRTLDVIVHQEDRSDSDVELVDKRNGERR